MMKTTCSHTGIEHCQHSAATPTAVLREEHEVILRALAVLERLSGELAAEKPVNPDSVQWLANFFRTFADRCHHAKEEKLLFPALERHGVPKEGGPLGVMLMEHEQGRALVRTFAEGDPPTAAKAMRSFVVLLRDHIAKENEILFPIADRVLPAPEQKTILEAFEAAECELGGPELHRQFLEELAQLESK